MGGCGGLERVDAGHRDAILAFELANRAWFARSISDRGDDFFDRFDDHLAELLERQERGIDACFVVVGADGGVVARCNLFSISDGVAELGYRVAEHVAGRGVATASVEEVCGLAESVLGLRAVTARVADDNTASRCVLAKAGFVETGRTDIHGRPARSLRRELHPAAPA